MNRFCSVIMAAGQGKRMKSDKPKVLFEVLSKPILDWVIDASIEAGSSKTCVICGHKKSEVKKHLADRVSTADQDQQRGTGHAVMMARDFINKNSDSAIIILSGDTPLITPELLSGLFTFHTQGGFAATILTGMMDDPFGYGRVIRSQDGSVLYIVEQKDANDKELEVKEINSGIYCFDPKLLLNALDKLDCNNAQGEYYLTDTIAIIASLGGKIGAFATDDTVSIMGINDRIQLKMAQDEAMQRVAEKLMINGVTIMETVTTQISPDAEIGYDTTILPGTIISGQCKIGKNCMIGPNSQLYNVDIKDHCEINASVLKECKVGNNTKIGPFAYIRPGSNIGCKVKVGDFVEIKNSNIGDETKISHLTYVGDSDVGERCNFGCGTVTVNYDGKKKYRITIGNNVFIGCNTNIIAPLKINNDSYIAAGSTITQEVPEGALAIARARQTNKEGWVKKREAEKR